MSERRLRDEVIAFVAARLKVPAASVKESTYFSSDLGLDSMRALELVGDVEDRFDCEIPEQKLRTLVTVGDLVALLERSKGGRA